jgi:hypothetical protein
MEPQTGVDHGLCLVVADRGHVWVGHVTTGPGPDFTQIDDARIVRRWGTSEGLNELAKKGPQPNTKLDAPATVKVATRAIIALIPCETASWIA